MKLIQKMLMIKYLLKILTWKKMKSNLMMKRLKNKINNQKL